MRKIKWVYLSLVIVLTATWLLADTLFPTPLTFFAARGAWVNYTGVLAMGIMSVGMILSMRPMLPEPWLGGLDKMYRLHKWLGITGLVLSILHWLWAKGPKWAVGWGLLDRPVRTPRVPPQEWIFQVFLDMRKLAEGVGEWTFYGLVFLVTLALIKAFPYRYFIKTHRVLALAYLAFVFHSVILMSFPYWSSAVGILSAILMIGGTIAAFASLFGKVGAGRRAVGEVEAIDYFADSGVIKVSLRLKDRWQGHQPGQFAFVSFEHDKEPHPFTISSAWTGDGRMVFLIKAAGDFTAALPAALKVGSLVEVEGPYGRFTFVSDKPRQIWVAGGIGITPFIARMKALELNPNPQSVDLFFSTRTLEDEALALLRQDAASAGVTLHISVGAEGPRITADYIRQAVPEWKAADIWFCGPSHYGHALKADFTTLGLASEHFHQELFEMR